MASQVSPEWSNKNLSLTMEPNTFDLWFTVDMDPLSVSTYYLKRSNTTKTSSISMTRIFTFSATEKIDRSFPNNGFLIVEADPKPFEVTRFMKMFDLS